MLLLVLIDELVPRACGHCLRDVIHSSYDQVLALTALHAAWHLLLVVMKHLLMLQIVGVHEVVYHRLHILVVIMTRVKGLLTQV
jgi:hypothetical protein